MNLFFTKSKHTNLHTSTRSTSFSFRNDEEIRSDFWGDYFGLSFCLKSGRIVDTMTDFKVKNKVKRSSQKSEFIFSPFLILFLFALLFFTSACNSTKFLKEGQYLIKKNSITLDSKYKIDEEKKLAYDLTFLYKQKENTNFAFFFPRERFYFKRNSPADTSAFDRFVRKYIAEKPAIYNDSLTQVTADAMKYTLHHKGYYYADVKVKTKKRRKKIKIEYLVNPGPQFMIDSVFFKSTDAAIDSTLQLIQADTYLKKGKGFDLGLFSAEQKRITEHFNNAGYAFFHKGYFDKLAVDTFQNKGKANIYINILPPPDKPSHQQYKIGKVSIYLDFNPTKRRNELQDTIIHGYTFISSNDEFIIKPEVVLQAVYFISGDYFQLKNKLKTNKQLSGLGIYRFVRIKQTIDSILPNILNISIELSPATKMEGGWDLEANYTNSNSSDKPTNLIGLSFKPSFKNRNLFRGAELLTINLDTGVEVNPFEKDLFWNTVDAGVITNLYLPQFLDYFGIWKGLHTIPWGKKKRVVSAAFFNALQENSATKISVSYTFQQVIDWYQRHLFSASYGYDIQRSASKRYVINHIGIDYDNPIFEENYVETILNNNPFIKRSFGQKVFFSLLFKNFDFIYTSRPNRFGSASYAGLSIELAGTEVWGVNALYNEFSLDPTTFKLGENIDFSQYIKFETDLRYSKKYGKKNQIATRLNLGIANAFGFTTDVPYVKQFSSGGANSIRAWLPRGLGPGGYLDSLSLDRKERNRLYQKGDLRLEFNAEYRFKLIGPLNLAVFIDGGNVWTSKLDTSRVGSQFLLKRKCITCQAAEKSTWNDSFFQQIALGTGLGFRIDLSFFVFRLDAGIKLRNPYPSSRNEDGIGTGYWQDLRKWTWNKTTLNFALGYPF